MKVVLAVSPVLEYAVTFAPTSAIWEKVAPSGERSILKPASFVALSVHFRSMRLVDAAVTVRLVGAAGAGWVVADALLLYNELFGPS